jgi:mono/diheme cytochrome c family protein
VDEHFANVYEEEHRLEQNRLSAIEHILHVAGARRDYQTRRWSMTFGEALTKLERPNSEGARALQGLAEVDRKIADLVEGPQALLGAEFARRGGWTRAYLVTDGHVHSHQHCSSCHKGESRTLFSWMIQYSGKTEEEIVEAAGERACTICYPSAPVARGLPAPKSVMFTQEEIDRNADRRAREERKAELAAKKAAKAITDADGGPLRVYTWTKKAHQKRHRATGEIVDVPEQEFSDLLATLHAARGWLTDRFETFRGDNGAHRDTEKVARAVAAKEGKTMEAALAEAQERARKRK